jgi:hypothetical protein
MCVLVVLFLTTLILVAGTRLMQAQAPADDAPSVNSSPPVERRAVNKLIKDFPEKTDLSTPESALAALSRSIVNRNAQQFVELFWIRNSAESIKKEWKKSPEIPVRFLDRVILEVHTYRDDLAEVIVETDSTQSEGVRYATTVFGKINGVWKKLNCDTEVFPNGDEFYRDFDVNKKKLWELFLRVKADVGNNINGTSSVFWPCATISSRARQRSVNKLLRDSPEKEDLSTPESALEVKDIITGKVKPSSGQTLDMEYPELQKRSAEEIEVFKALAETMEETFKTVESRYNQGSRGGEQEKYDLTGLNAELAKADLAWAEGRVEDAYAHTYRALSFAKKYLRSAAVAYEAGRITMSSLGESQTSWAKTRLQLIRAEKVAKAAGVDLTAVKRREMKSESDAKLR